MLQYVAFVWDAESPRHCERAAALLRAFRAERASWSFELAQEGLAIACSHGGDVQLLGGGSAGAIVGQVWKKPGDDPSTLEPGVPQLTAAERDRVVASAGRELVERFWGNYVCFIRDPSRRAAWVLRAPATLLPCLHVTVDGVEVYFSSLDIVCRPLDLRLSVNWLYVARALLGPHRSTVTGLNDIDEVEGGVCQEILFPSGRRVDHRFWCPLTCSRATRLNTFQEAAGELRRTIVHCVRASASLHHTVLVSLSGGLDSSIVLASLKTSGADTRIVCLTQFAHGYESDERVFARLAADHARCDLIEKERTPDIDLRSLFGSRTLERCAGFHVPEVDRIEPEAASHIGATAIFKGHGGDELFCRHSQVLALEDRLRERAGGKGILGLALHTAVLEGETFWLTLVRAIRNACFPPSSSLASQVWQQQEGESLLDPDWVAEALKADQARTQIEEPDGLPRGHLLQYRLATGWRPYITPFTREEDPPTISPLLSQPVIEVCLRFPTWFQMEGRRDRAVARWAFKQDLPAAILDRRGKGGAEALAWEVVTRNRAFMREALLDGQLVRRNMVDRTRLEAALGGGLSNGAKAAVPLLEMLAMEAWLSATAQAPPVLDYQHPLNAQSRSHFPSAALRAGASCPSRASSP